MQDTPAIAPPPAAPRHRFARWELPIAAALLIAALVAAIDSSRRDSVTIDELAHLTAGMSFLKTGDYRLLFGTPPLAQMWAALPLLAGERAWPSTQDPNWRRAEVWQIARTWMLGEKDAPAMIDTSRLMMTAVLASTLVLIYLTARKLFGPVGGIIALAVAAANPALLAHGRLITTDVPIALALLGLVLAFVTWLERPNLRTALLLALVLAAAALTKYTFLLAFPVLALILAIYALRSWRTNRGRRRIRERRDAVTPRHTWRNIGIAAALCIVIPWLAIWTCFGFRYAAHTGEDRDRALMIWLRDGKPEPASMSEVWRRSAVLADGKPLEGATVGLVQLARNLQLLPEAYLYGLFYTLRTASDERSAFMHGEFTTSGWYSYFPFCFSVKFPHGTQIVALLALGALVVRRDLRQKRPLLLVGVIALGGIYFAVAVGSLFNIGERHLLPAYLPLFILCGAAATWTSHMVGRLGLGAALAWSIAAAALAHPHYLPYFNELAGGSANGYKLLLDSNVDWGQDLRRLAELQAQEQTRLAPPDDLRIFYFGSAPPACYGIRGACFVNFLGVGEIREATPGTYVISVNELFGMGNPISRAAYWRSGAVQADYRRLFLAASGVGGGEMSPRDRQLFEFMKLGRLLVYLQQQPPERRVGYSLFVYRVTPEVLEAATRP